MNIVLSVFYDPKDLGIRYLTTWLRDKGHNVKIVALKTQSDVLPVPIATTKEKVDKCNLIRDGQISEFIQNDITPEELRLFTEEIAKAKPDVIGFGTRSKNFKYLDRIIPAMKKAAPNAFLIAGGAGPTIDPLFPLKAGVDAVNRGEGEYAMEELLEALSSGKEWRGIKNISYLDEDNNLVNNPFRYPEKKLDNFPFPAMRLENDIVIENNAAKPIFDPSDTDVNSFSNNFRYFILGSRGCMGDCSYCGGRFFHSIYKNEGLTVPRVRQRSLKNVLAELKEAKKKFPMRVVQFWDEFFVWPIDELTEFFTEYKRDINLPFWIYLSPDQLYNSPDLLNAVMEAGLATFSVGLQTGDEDFCKRIYNRKNNNKHILSVSRAMLERHIPVQLLMILGNPLQKEESLKKNWEFLRQLPFDPSFVRRVWVSITKLYAPPYETKLFSGHKEIFSVPISNRQFYYDSLIALFSHILPESEFNTLIEDKFYKENPWQLGNLLINTYESEHRKYLNTRIKDLGESEVYYWGNGSAYGKRKNLFQSVKPIALFNDLPGNNLKEVDGIPVIYPMKEEIDNEKPLVIFARSQYIHSLYKKAKYELGFKNIITAANID